MVIPSRACWRIGAATWVLAGLLPGSSLCRADDFRLESVGVRGGISSNQAGGELGESQAFANWNLPWDWDLGKEWHLQSRLELSAGWLGDSDKQAAIGTIGPGVVVSRAQWPLSLEGGSSPTMLSRYRFARLDMGMDFQFTTHVGLNWDFAEHWRLGYRFEHISNADLAKPDPGLNMHLVTVSYRF